MNYRISQIHKRLAERRRKMDTSLVISAANLAREFGVTAKTLQRDLRHMRDSLKLPLEYDETEHSWCYTEDVTQMPTVSFTEGELLALVMAKSALHRYRGMPFERHLTEALGKLERQLDSTMRADPVELDAAVSFRHPGSPVGDMKAFETISRAVISRRRLEFFYLKNHGARHEIRRVEPYHLTSVGFEWYLVAKDQAHGELRNFRLGAMRDVTMSKGAAFPDPAFDGKKYFSGSFGLFVGDDAKPVTIRFYRRAAEVVPTGDWHHTQRFTPGADGSVLLEMTTGGFHEIAKWLLPFGDLAEVIEPPELIATLKERCEEILRRYP